MKIPSLKDHKTLICGIQGSGKSVCGRYITLRKFKRPIAIQATHDYDDLENLTLIERDTTKSYADQIEELATYLVQRGRLVEQKELASNDYDALIIDEADVAYQGNYDIGEYFNELVAKHRHFKVAIVFLTRRPQDIPAKIRESCKYRIVYFITGEQAIKALRGFDPRMPKLVWGELQEDENGNMQRVGGLNPDKHEFVFQDNNKDPIVCSKVPLV